MRFGEARDGHVLKVEPMLPGKRRAGAGEPLEHTQLVERNDLDIVDVGCRAPEAMPDGGDKPSETVQRDRLGERLVDLQEKLPPGRRQLR